MTRKSVLKPSEADAISENTKGMAVLRKESEESIVASESLMKVGMNLLQRWMRERTLL